VETEKILYESANGPRRPAIGESVTLFDPAKILGRSTIQYWNVPPDGIPDVMVSGQ
jgi:hypothetical protein